MTAKLDEQVMILKADGSREFFDPEKLRSSLLHSGATEKDAIKVLAHILPELHRDMKTSEIYQHAFAVLQEISRPAARSYSLRRAVMNLGPSGFPFEDFVAEILKAKGFKCEARQTVLGGCVPHEVDVVAYNADKLIMVEAKFHNELGSNSDLKVALYVKARFDDLRGNVYDYGGTNRKITDCWLVTNTKFSSTAIHYGACQNLTMIGWNYPAKGNLQNMIEEEGIHPVTCLVSLSDLDKKTLITGGIVLCADIKKDPSILKKFLGESFQTEPIINEINEL